MKSMRPATHIDGSGGDRHPGVSLWDGASAQSLAHALEPPVVYCVEQGLRDAMLEVGGLFHSLGLAITTRAAFRLPVANAFVDAVDQRLHLDDDLRVRMLTVLHEAVINAVLHGNLGLGSGLRDDFAHMARLQRIIERRLADSSLGDRMVFIEASWTTSMHHLLVRDCGNGFTRELAFGSPEAEGDRPRSSGRGLYIIEQLSDSVEYLNNGSAIRIGFKR
jgi:anti-sigma regulatory factor (Ser/Thr protein kinase)